MQSGNQEKEGAQAPFFIPKDLDAGLQLIRLRRRRMGHILLGLIPFVLVAGSIGYSLSELETMWFILAAAIYGALLLAYSLRLAFTECPRCHGFYHCRSWLDPTTPQCLHCGLPLKAEA